MYVFCSTCECDFSCARGGKGDCIQHVKSRSHLDSKFFTLVFVLGTVVVPSLVFVLATVVVPSLVFVLGTVG
jgi:hypothetical protein